MAFGLFLFGRVSFYCKWKFIVQVEATKRDSLEEENKLFHHAQGHYRNEILRK